MIYKPDFEDECAECGSSPCVLVEGHVVPKTFLCGPHFFLNPKMVDYEEWNATEEDEV